MRTNRGLLFWGLVLVVGGGVALAAQQDYLDREMLREAWRLWPLILVAIGLAIILARTPFAWAGTVTAALVVGIAAGALFSVGPGIVSCGGPEPTNLEARDGSFSGSTANVTLDFNCGSLGVGMAPGTNWRTATGVTGTDKPIRISSTGSSLTVRSPEAAFDFTDGRQKWEVTLGSDVSYDLDVSANAADTTLDLAGGTFSRVNIDPNAGSVVVDLTGATLDELRASLNAGSLEITVDAATQIDGGRIDTNAGSIQLCTSSGTAVRITSDSNFTFSHNLDSSGLSQSGRTWTSPGFASAAHTITLTVDGNAASFTLNPSGGCS